MGEGEGRLFQISAHRRNAYSKGTLIRGTGGGGGNTNSRNWGGRLSEELGGDAYPRNWGGRLSEELGGTLIRGFTVCIFETLTQSINNNNNKVYLNCKIN